MRAETGTKASRHEATKWWRRQQGTKCGERIRTPFLPAWSPLRAYVPSPALSAAEGCLRASSFPNSAHLPSRRAPGRTIDALAGAERTHRSTDRANFCRTNPRVILSHPPQPAQTCPNLPQPAQTRHHNSIRQNKATCHSGSRLLASSIFRPPSSSFCLPPTAYCLLCHPPFLFHAFMFHAPPLAP